MDVVFWSFLCQRSNSRALSMNAVIRYSGDGRVVEFEIRWWPSLDKINKHQRRCWNMTGIYFGMTAFSMSYLSRVETECISASGSHLVQWSIEYFYWFRFEGFVLFLSNEKASTECWWVWLAMSWGLDWGSDIGNVQDHNFYDMLFLSAIWELQSGWKTNRWCWLG